MADSLEDDFAGSDVGSMADEDIGGDAGGERSETGKRKQGGGSDGGKEEEGEEDRRRRKKQKRRENDKRRKAKKAADGSGQGASQVAGMPPDMQADYLRKMVKSCKQFSKMSDLELDEIAIREAMLLDGSQVKVERRVDKLANFIEAAMPSVGKSVASASEKGCPVVLVVTGNAQRAADLAKVLREISPLAEAGKQGAKRQPVAKLFARHFKLAEQEAFLKSNVCPLAVGTPQRLHDLLQADKGASVKVDQLRAIVLDASWMDAKRRTLLDGAETKEALAVLLAMPPIQARLKARSESGNAFIVLF